MTISAVIPQNSCLPPILFTVYNNEIPSKLFANDIFYYTSIGKKHATSKI